MDLRFSDEENRFRTEVRDFIRASLPAEVHRKMAEGRALTKDEVFFELKDEVSPGVFKTLESFVCVIMPVRLS